MGVFLLWDAACFNAAVVLCFSERGLHPGGFFLRAGPPPGWPGALQWSAELQTDETTPTQNSGNRAAGQRVVIVGQPHRLTSSVRLVHSPSSSTTARVVEERRPSPRLRPRPRRVTKSQLTDRRSVEPPGSRSTQSAGGLGGVVRIFVSTRKREKK